MVIETLGRTKFEGNFNITGLPEVESTFFDFNIQKLLTDRRSIEAIPLPPFTGENHLVLPENISWLGLIYFQGKLSGFINDFVSYGKFKTSLGSLVTDINLKFNEHTGTTEYSGRLETDHFLAGKFLDSDNILGAVTMKTEIAGKGLSKEKVSARIKGNIDNIELNGYGYKNITVSGDFSKGLN